MVAKRALFLKKFFIVFCIFVGAGYVWHERSARIEIVLPKNFLVETAYGTTMIDEPVLIELIHSPAMQRLKKVNQYGIVYFVRPHQKYNRYQHSLAVFYLLRHFGASLEEQVAGLLHDVSHTAFSHVADYLHGVVTNKYAYQDTQFAWYLDRSGILSILKKYNLEQVAGFAIEEKYQLLKPNLPNLGADRLEYNLYGGYLEGWLTQEEMVTILNHVKIQNGQWFFDDSEYAKKFAEVSVNLSVHNWNSAFYVFINTMMANVLKRALTLGLVTMHELQFSIDEEIWNKLISAQDSEMQELIMKIKDQDSSYKLGSAEQYDLYQECRFKGIDPLVETESGLVLLSSVDSEFKQFFEHAKSLCHGQYIIYT